MKSYSDSSSCQVQAALASLTVPQPKVRRVLAEGSGSPQESRTATAGGNDGRAQGVGGLAPIRSPIGSLTLFPLDPPPASSSASRLPE